MGRTLESRGPHAAQLVARGGERQRAREGQRQRKEEERHPKIKEEEKETAIDRGEKEQHDLFRSVARHLSDAQHRLVRFGCGFVFEVQGSW